MNNKIIIGTLLSTTLLITGVASASFVGFEGKFNKGLSDEEKTALETMTRDERHTFMQAKRAERESTMLAREAVIDKLLNQESLNDDENKIRLEMIQERSDRKAQREARKAQMDELFNLLEKKKTGATLTDDEQARLEELQGSLGDGMGRRGGERGAGHMMMPAQENL